MTVEQFKETATGTQLVCRKANGELCNYWPVHTGNVVYAARLAEIESTELSQEAGRGTAVRCTASGDCSSSRTSGQEAKGPPTVAPSLALEDGVPSETSSGWKISSLWRKAPSIPDIPPVRFATGPAMLPIVLENFEKIRSSFSGWCYCLDHTSACLTLCLKASKGASGRLLFDRDNFFSSSCARQCPRLIELYKEGVEMRYVKPSGSGFACMHVKAWLLDEDVLMTGSVNITHGGLENNIEHLYVIAVPSVVAETREHFEQVWAGATTVGQADIDIMKKKWDAREAAKVRSSSRSVSRSLSQELDDS